MKKYAVIGLVLAALALGSCKDGEKGGTIVIVNNYKELGVAMLVTVNISSVLPFVFKTETIPAGETKEVPLDKDGTYKITTVLAKANPSSVTLSGGNTVRVTLE